MTMDGSASPAAAAVARVHSTDDVTADVECAEGGAGDTQGGAGDTHHHGGRGDRAHLLPAPAPEAGAGARVPGTGDAGGETRRPLLGLLLMLLASLDFSVMGLVVTLCSRWGMPSFEMVFFRGAVQAVLVCMVLPFYKGKVAPFGGKLLSFAHGKLETLNSVNWG